MNAFLSDDALLLNFRNHKMTVSESLQKLRAYIEKEHYEGYDPYDALKSPFLNTPVVNDSFLIRFLIQQFFKRSPINLRAVFSVKKGLNPVTLGLCIQGYTYMGKSGLLSNDETINICENLIHKLKNLIPTGYHGACWGYEFPWQSRHFSADSYEPSIVATGIITNALFQYHSHFKSTAASSLCVSASHFVLNDLNRIHEDESTFCLSYTTKDHYPVFNANMKGARLLSQAFCFTNDKSLAEIAAKTVKYTMNHQNIDGSWYYAPGKKGNWVDNYHTGYVLECANEYAKLTGDLSYSSNLKSGFEYYLKNFLVNDSIPKFYNNQTYPIDCTAGAQTILTLINFGKEKLALNTALFMISQMQSNEGFFYFRKHRYHMQKQSYMRWSNAWMFAALARIGAST